MSTMQNILVVDDEPAVCWALTQLFTLQGCYVSAVHTGAEALVQLAERPLTHILLDAKLQDMDGLTLAAAARARNPGAVVLLISGFYYRNDPTIRRAIADAHIDGFIPKPFTHAEVMRWVLDSAPKHG